MSKITQFDATARVARLLAREARLIARCGDDDDARAAQALAELLSDPDRVAKALAKPTRVQAATERAVVNA